MSGTKGDHPDGFTAIILAAGQGTRMRSQRPKVLHEIAGLAMLGHLLTSVRAAGATTVCVVTSPQQDDVRSFVAGHDARATTVVQEAQRGTADAVLAARSVLETVGEPVLVLAGDVPLVTPETLQATARRIREGADVVVVGFTAADPTGYGRLICDASGMLRAIVEHADASAQERAITLCNSGFIGIDGEKTLTLLDDIGNDNAQGEFYLTDVVAIARARGGDAVVYEAPADDVRGVNSRAQLAEVEAIWQARRRRTLMEEGVSMAAPATVHLTHDTQIAPDAFIEPNVVFGPGVRVASGTRIRAFSHLEGAHVASGCVVGPYARLRPGTVLAADVKIGNFVETKAAEIAAGAKVNHLTYIGDAEIGEGANIGAGTITCNYDGFAKHRTRIGPGAFVGSNSALVAPVRIGAEAYVGSGSVITKDVADGALAVTRAAQVEKPGWVTKFRALMQRRKDRAS